MILTLARTSLFSLFLIILPLKKSDTVDLRNIHEELVISLSSNSPAMAAFLDGQLDFEEDTSLEYEVPIQLRAGFARSDIQQKLSKIVDVYGALSENQNINLVTFNDLPPLHDEAGELLPVVKRKEIISKFISENPLLDSSSDNWQKKARDLMATMQASDIAQTNEKTLISANHFSPITIKKSDEEQGQNRLKKESVNRESPSTTKLAMPYNVSGSSLTRINTLTIENSYEKYVISGEIELGGGLAFAGETSSLHIYREFDGEIVNAGTVWVEQGRYEIAIDDLRGYLIAELINDEGETLGISEVDLFSWENLPYENNRIDGVHVYLAPIDKGLQLEVHSSRSFKGHILKEKEAKVVVDGLARSLSPIKESRYLDKNFKDDSMVWSTTSKAKHWNTLAPLQGYGYAEIQLFPDLHMDALAADLDIDVKKETGWIFGRLKGEEGPLEDVSVEVIDLMNTYKTYYFSMVSELVFWPDKKARKTSSNGMFVIPDLDPGIYALRVKKGEDYFPSEVVRVGRRQVTYLDLTYDKMKTASVNVFDKAFGVNYLSAYLHAYGTEKDLFINGNYKDSLIYPSGKGTMTFEVDAGSEYMLSKTLLSRNVRALRLPVIAKKWFTEINQKVGNEVDSSQGIIVGYVNGDDYDVLLGEEIKDTKVDIIYFDDKGYVSELPYGANGGGFIITNLPVGQITLAVVPHNKKSLVMRVLTTEKGYVNTFETSL